MKSDRKQFLRRWRLGQLYYGIHDDMMKTAFYEYISIYNNEKQIFWDFYYEDFKFRELLKKIHIKMNTSTLQQGTHEIGFFATLMLVCVFV